MTSCTEIRANIQLLVDGELTPEEQQAVFDHLEDCRECQAALRREENIAGRVRAARPNIQAPDSLRQRIAALAAEHERQAPAARPLPARRLWRWTPIASAACAAVLAVAATATLSHHADRQKQVANLDQTALLVHHALQSNQLPLDIESSSPEQLTAWFTQRLDFPFHLANAGIAADHEARYTLAGGRLINVNSRRAALVSFRLSHELVSMLVAPGSLDINTHGKPVSSGGITLYARDQETNHIVSWKNRGLSYVLVSHTSMSDSGSCVRCHAEHGSQSAGREPGNINASATARPQTPSVGGAASWSAIAAEE
jgi:anti-sigma factor RsiW